MLGFVSVCWSNSTYSDSAKRGGNRLIDLIAACAAKTLQINHALIM
jgi:hypothetical protein